MCRDEEFFESPHSFNPNRFISALTTKGDKSVPEHNTKLRADDPSEIIFGFGRR
jgi:cytochrome P450